MRIKCQKCKGKGALYQFIRNPGTCTYEEQYTRCDVPFCEDGIFNRDAYAAAFANYGKPAHSTEVAK